jgi:hypothetical protein
MFGGTTDSMRFIVSWLKSRAPLSSSDHKKQAGVLSAERRNLIMLKEVIILQTTRNHDQIWSNSDVDSK